VGWVYGIHSLSPAVIREISALSADEIDAWHARGLIP